MSGLKKTSKSNATAGTKHARKVQGRHSLARHESGKASEMYFADDAAEGVRQAEGGAEETVALPEFIHPHPMAVHIRLLFNLGRFEGINFFHNRRQK